MFSQISFSMTILLFCKNNHYKCNNKLLTMLYAETPHRSSVPLYITPDQRSYDTSNVHGSGLLRKAVSRNYQDMREELFSKVYDVYTMIFSKHFISY